MRAMNLTAGLWLTLVLCGCPSLTNMHTARPITAGRTQLGVEGMALSAGTLIEDESLTTGHFELHVRHGINESMDFGVKAYPIGFQADLNYMLVDTGSFALSLDPALTLFAVTGAVGIYPWLALLFDIGTPDGMVLTLGPRIGAIIAAGEGGGGVLTGGVVGLRLPVSEAFTIMPEFTGYAALGGGDALFVWTGGVAFAFLL